MPPTLALFAGDPTGVGPEIVAKVLAAPESLPPARVLLIASRAGVEAAARIAGVELDFDTIYFRDRGDVDVIMWDGWKMPPMTADQPNAARGGFMLAGLRLALDLARQKRIDCVCFAPVDRAALRAAGMNHEDELHWGAQILDHHAPCHEIQVLDNIWTVLIGRSPAGDAVAFSAEDLAGAISVLADVMRRAGKLGGRIAVCAPKPADHANAQAEIISAGVRLAIARGFTAAEGPLAAEAAFDRARSGGLDGVITTDPDQNPVTATLMGYERAVTVFGGLPAAVTTTAHGPAYDIAGRGIANPWALRNAMTLALRIASG